MKSIITPISQKLLIAGLLFVSNFFFTNPLSAQYCSAKGNGCTEPNTDNHISLFIITGKFTNETTCEPGGYGDYTNIIATATQGEALNGSIKCNKPGYFFGQAAIWIDWNNNFSFNDPGENIYVASTAQNWQGVANTFTIEVPPNASFGAKRLRVRTSSTTGTMNPCGVQGIGEVEDYILAIIDPNNLKAIAGFTSDAKVSCAEKRIKFTNSSKYSDSVHWFFPGGNPSFGRGDTLSVSYDSAGMYDVKLLAFNAKGNDSTEKKDYLTINPKDNADFTYPDSFFCQNGKIIMPTILGISGGTFIGDPSSIALDSETGEIDVNLSTPGAYTVTYLTTGQCYSEKSVSLIIDPCTGINLNQDDKNLFVYPNPAQNKLFIDIKNNADYQKLKILSLEGKLL